MFAAAVSQFLREQELRYPVLSKADFADQMARQDRSFVADGRRYDVGSAVKLIPAFLFPVVSEDDLVAKVIDLLTARGLVPFEDRRRHGTCAV